MREWKPHGTNLLPPRHQAVQDPARDDEVGAGVEVGQREVRSRVVDGCRGAGNERCESNQACRRAIRTLVVPRLVGASVVMSVLVVSGFSRTKTAGGLVEWIRRGGQNVF